MSLLDHGAQANIGRDLLASENISDQVRELVEPYLIWDKMYHFVSNRSQFDILARLLEYFLPRPPSLWTVFYLSFLRFIVSPSAEDNWYVTSKLISEGIFKIQDGTFDCCSFARESA